MGWRRDIKNVILKAFDGKCGICGYNKCDEALEFHHIDPTKKDFSISCFKFEEVNNIIRELKKCVCVCGNCHREIHNEITTIPKDIYRYNTGKSKNIIMKFKEIYDTVLLKRKQKKKRKLRYRN